MTARPMVALVTGGSRGIGKAIALRLGTLGLHVGITYADQHDLAEEVATEIVSAGGEAISVRLELGYRESVDAACAEVASQFGPVNVLVNNAAISQEISFDQITETDWDTMMAVNLRGPYFCCQAVIPAMVRTRWGRIVNIVSIVGQWGGINQVHYATAKAGLIGFTRSLARVFSGVGVTSNAVAPGLVHTEMSAEELETDAGRRKVSEIPIGRIATSEEVASAVAYLISEDASYITGQTINVNGGMLFN